MRRLFDDSLHDRHFAEMGYVVVDLLDAATVAHLLACFEETFRAPRQVVPFARELPYYISVFDTDHAHRRVVDGAITACVAPPLATLMPDYEAFVSNFMIKFPGDGEIEAHQDFNFVDETRFTACNLWCPLTTVQRHQGGLCVVPGSHRVFRTQRGPNLPRALTEHNALLGRHARWVAVAPGQAVIFDHRLVHTSPANAGETARVAVQSVLKPRRAPTVHYVYQPRTRRVQARRIDRAFVLDNDLWDTRLDDRPLDHEQALIDVPDAQTVRRSLVRLRLRNSGCPRAEGEEKAVRPVLVDAAREEALCRDGFVTLPVLERMAAAELCALCRDWTGGAVENTDYGMYISLEADDETRKRALIATLSQRLLPRIQMHFRNCKAHLGSFLVKAADGLMPTCPHQDWTFVDAPRFRSVTVWVALVDTDEHNGTLGFVPGSHRFFDHPVGSPSPPFATSTQGHEALLYEYLRFVPLRAGEAVVFDNRTIHGAPPNGSDAPRIAAAIGLTPREAPLLHYFVAPADASGRTPIARLAVDEDFFVTHPMSTLRALHAAGRLPAGVRVEALLDLPAPHWTGEDIRLFCEESGLARNGHRLQMPGTAPPRRRGWLRRLGTLWRERHGARRGGAAVREPGA